MIRIETGSDDCIDVEGLENDEGICTNAQDGVYGVFVIGDPVEDGPAARVELHYTTKTGERFKGCWCAVIGPVEDNCGGDGREMPQIDLHNDGYNLHITIHVDRGTPVVYGKASEFEVRSQGHRVFEQITTTAT